MIREEGGENRVRRVNHEEFKKRIQIKRECIGVKIGEKMSLWASKDIES